MILLVLVFMLEFAFAFLPKYVNQLTTLIAKMVYSVTNEEMNLRAEIKDLKEEQSQLSVTDDFVRYAKIQRKVDKLMASVKEKVNERKQKMSYLNFGVTLAIYVFHALALLLLMIFLHSEPLGHLPESWLFPLNKLVAFPCGIPGSIGLGCWIAVSNSVIQRGKHVLGL